MSRVPLRLFLSLASSVSLPALCMGAGTHKVNTTQDTVDVSPGDGIAADSTGKTSLRAAIQEANASGGSQKIKLPAGFTFILSIDGAGEDNAATGDLDIDSKIRIDGNGSTIVAAAGDRVFDIGPTGDLSLDDVTLRGGVAPDGENGGNIRNVGKLSITRSTLEYGEALGVGGSGGNLFNSGTAEVDESVFAGGNASRAGGAIEANGGSTTVTKSLIVQNRAGDAPGNGGGLHLTGAGTVTIDSTTFDSNVAAREGGGAWNSSSGAMDVSNSTFANNVANGDAADDGGGAIFNDGGTLLINKTDLLWNLAPGTSGSGGGILSIGGAVTVNKTEITRNEASRAGGGIEIVDGSLAIDNTTLSTNRALSSPGNGGALHVTGTSTNVTIDSSTIFGNEAALEGGGLWNQAGSTLTVTKSILRGNSATGDAADDGGGAIFNNGGTVTLQETSILGNLALGTAGSGGGILSLSGNVSVDKGSVSGNSASRAGGGIEVVTGTVDLMRLDFEANVAASNPGNGGAVHVSAKGAEVNVFKSSFVCNQAASEGGALWNQAGSTMNVSKSTFTNNVAAGDGADQGGGALFNNGGSLEVSGSLLDGNSATGTSGSGGGILNDQGTLTVQSTTIRNNSANRAGGGIETNIGDVTTTKVDLLNNTVGSSPGNGGALHITGAGSVNLAGGKIFNNVAANEGGGLWNSATGTLTATGIKFKSNAAPTGDDVFTQPGGTTTIQ